MNWKFLILLLWVVNGSYAQSIFDPSPFKILKKEGAVLSLAFQPDGKAILVGSEDKKCVLWSLVDGKEIFSLPGLIGGAKACAYTADNKYFLVAADRSVRIYYPNGEFVNQKGGPATDIWSFSVNQTTNKIAFGSYDKNIRITDFTNGKLTTITGHTKNALAVKYSPDNKLLASGSLDQSVRIWDAVSLNPLFTFSGHGGNIFDLVFTPDSKKLLSASDDNSIRIWDLESQKFEKNLLGNAKAILCLAVSPDGYYLLSGSFDGALMLWDIVRGENIYTFHEHTGAINALAYSTDGKCFASGSADKSVLIWELKPEMFIEKYFSAEMKDEMDKSGLFVSKAKEETKDAYKIRLSQSDTLKTALIDKYYSKYLAEIKGKPLK